MKWIKSVFDGFGEFFTFLEKDDRVVDGVDDNQLFEERSHPCDGTTGIAAHQFAHNKCKREDDERTDHNGQWQDTSLQCLRRFQFQFTDALRRHMAHV